MNKNYILLATVAAFTMSAPVFAADKEKFESKTKIEADSKGNYDKKTETESTDTAGTSTSTKQKVDVDVDANGNVDKTVKTVETKDPKGLFNKTKVKTTDTEKASADGTVMKHKKVVNGHTEVNTTESTK